MSKGLVKRLNKAVSIIMAVAMLLGTLPAELFGGVTDVSAAEGTVAAGWTFFGSNEDVETYAGIDFKEITFHDGSHGLQTGSEASMSVNLENNATVAILGCGYGTQGSVTATGHTVKTVKLSKKEGDNAQVMHTVFNAPAGKLELSFDSGMFVHGIYVEYVNVDDDGQSWNLRELVKQEVTDNNRTVFSDNIGIYHGLLVDATNKGEFSNAKSGDWTWVKQGTIIKVPVGKSCEVTVITYQAGKLTVDGTLVSETVDNAGKLVKNCAGTDGYVTLEATADGYIGSITVVPKEMTMHAITVIAAEHGTAEASDTQSAAGNKITLTATADSGYALRGWNVVNDDTNESVDVADNAFVMPDADVSVTAIFEKILSKWDFATDDSIRGANGGKIEGTTGRASCLGINASAAGAKWDSTTATDDNPWADAAKGTRITVPVEVPMGDQCTIIMGTRTDGYTVNGTAASTVTEADGKRKFQFIAGQAMKEVEIVITGDGNAIGYIEAKVEQLEKFVPKGATAFQQEQDSWMGITLEDIVWHDNQHGLNVSNSTTKTGSMTLNLEFPANITITGCSFTKEGATINAKSGETSYKVTDLPNGSAGSESVPMYAVNDVAAGKLTLEFVGAGAVYIHQIYVDYVIEEPDTPRKFDVWDFGGKQESDTEKYENQISVDDLKALATKLTNGVYDADGNIAFGDVTVNVKGTDRMYTKNEDLGSIDAGYTNFGKTVVKFEEDYTSDGAYYANGSGGSGRRYVTLSNVRKGDKIVVYAGIHGGSATQFVLAGDGGAAAQKEQVECASGEFKKMEFAALYNGSYKIYENGAGKPAFYRVVRIPGVTVSGSIKLGECTATNYVLKFINKTTNQTTVAETGEDHTFSVKLAPGYDYTAVFSDVSGWGLTTATQDLTVTEDDVFTGIDNKVLEVEAKNMCTYSGKIIGFEEGYANLSKLSFALVADKESNANDITFTPNADLTYSVELETGVKYELQMSGANDYDLTGERSIQLNEDDTTSNITVSKKNVYAASGKLIGLPEGVQVTQLKFVNEDDKYGYDAVVANGGYTATLRDGAYLATVVEISDTSYSTKTHVVIQGEDASKDLLFVSSKTPSLTRVPDIYVGYPDKENNYATVTEAVAACKAMNPTKEEERITVHIAPGTYREQVLVNTPYISFVNDTEDPVVLTWYYGIGYKYYSADGGYYSAEKAFDRYGKAIAARWGTTVRIQSKAIAFRAEGITFENSFNRYVTEEEIADGVELATKEEVSDRSNTLTERTLGMDVQTSDATERAAALCVEADYSEFYNCSFYSSQDTLYTQEKSYFKNCFIEGETDYIFGQLASCVFDNCELSWKGYSGTSKPGYITANRGGDNSNIKGYLFRNSTITGNVNLNVVAGYLGRPWDKNAKVVFLNTKLESNAMILPEGWKDMSGNQPANANFREYNTTLADGTVVDLSTRNVAEMTKAEAEAIRIADYYGDWVPVYLEKEAPVVTKVAAPTADQAEGEVAKGTKVTLTSATEDARIYYTLDGTDPTDKGILYEAPIVISETVTIKAIAVKGENKSAIKTFNYKVAGDTPLPVVTVGNPTASPAAGTVARGTKISLTAIPADAKIYYTTDKSEPTVNSTLYTEPIMVTENMTIKAIAVKDGCKDSEAVAFAYTVGEASDMKQVKMPKANPGLDTAVKLVAKGTKVKLSTVTTDAVIYYTTNETIPTKTSMKYDGAIVVNADTIIKAIAVKDGYTDSAVATYIYKVLPDNLDYGDILPEDIEELMQKYETGTDKDKKLIPDGLWIAGLESEGYEYTGSAIKPVVRVYSGNVLLREKADYTITYKNNTKAVTDIDLTADQTTLTRAKAPMVMVTGKGNYSGKEVAAFKILPICITDNEAFEADNMSFDDAKKAVKQVPVLYWNGKSLKKNTDYFVSGYSKLNGINDTVGTPVDKIEETGDYLVKLEGKGNFTGTCTVEWKVDSDLKQISGAKVTGITAQTYERGGVEPSPTVSFKGETLQQGTHYTVSYSNHTQPGTAYVIITGIGEYTGTKRVAFKINGTAIKGAVVTGIEDRSYDGSEQELDIGVSMGGGSLVEGDDYVVSYSNNINAGKAVVTITGINAYSGVIKKNFKIRAYDMNGEMIGMDDDVKAKYSKGGAKPELNLTFDGRILREGVDYSVTYKNNKAFPATKQPQAVIKGKGNFAGTKTVDFTIEAKPLKNVICVVPDVAKNNAGKYISKPVLTDVDGKKLVLNKDYEIGAYTLADGTELAASGVSLEVKTKIKVHLTGKGAYAVEGGDIDVEYEVNEYDFSKAKITVKPQTYTGKSVTLKADDITMKVGGATLETKDYKILEGSYINNVKKGTAQVTLVGQGDYAGTKTVKFKIGVRKFAWFWR